MSSIEIKCLVLSDSGIWKIARTVFDKGRTAIPTNQESSIESLKGHGQHFSQDLDNRSKKLREKAENLREREQMLETESAELQHGPIGGQYVVSS